MGRGVVVSYSDDISFIILQSNTQSHALVMIFIVNMKHDWLQ